MNPNAIISLPTLEASEIIYQRVHTHMDRLTDEELSTVNVDIPYAASVVMGVAPRIVTLRNEIDATFKAFDLANVDLLTDYAHLALYVAVSHSPVSTGMSVEALLEECTRTRGRLLRWVGPLAEEGRVDATHLERIREGSGHRDTGADVIALVSLIRARWDELQHIGVFTEEELTRAAYVGSALFHTAAMRQQAITLAPDVDSQRVRRAWTLLDRAYTECRRAVQYLRFRQGDADEFAPSLRRNLGPRKNRQAEPTTEPSAPPPPVVPPVPAGPEIGGGGSPFITPGG